MRLCLTDAGVKVHSSSDCNTHINKLLVEPLLQDTPEIRTPLYFAMHTFLI